MFKITKIELQKLQLKKPRKKIRKYFVGPTAAAISSDPISTAKILTKFSKSNNKLKIVAGLVDGKVLDEKEVSIMETLPSLEEARAKTVGILGFSCGIRKYFTCTWLKIANLARAKSLKLIHRSTMADLNKIIDELSTLTVVEAAELPVSA